MLLHYYDALPNFGDRLNPWLWPQLLPGGFGAGDETIFLGIGTILQARVPAARRYAVLGAGLGYGAPPQIDARWQFFAVRGPLSARALGLAPDLAVTDAAYLLRLVPLPTPVAGPRIGFMPHWRSLRRVPWAAICEWSGLRFINPLDRVEHVLGELRGCDCVIAEAMHGAITADLLRIRWFPVRLGEHFLDFKWQDWLASIELNCTPQSLTPMDPWTEHRHGDARPTQLLRRAVNLAGYYARSLPLIAELRSLRRTLEQQRARAFLSDAAVFRQRVDTLESRLDALRQMLSAALPVA